jgi:hypothetical protein
MRAVPAVEEQRKEAFAATGDAAITVGREIALTLTCNFPFSMDLKFYP